MIGSARRHPDTQVLIVGAGPAGLFAAGELARHGIVARLVERDPAPHHQARATAVQPAVLELLARAGLLDRFLEASTRVRRVRFLGPGFQELAVASFDGIGCAHEYQCSLPQWQTEAILTEHLERLGGRVERGATALAIDGEDGALRVTLGDSEGGTEAATFGYVIGAGGAHSVTRSSMQELLAGETYRGRYIVADVCLGLPRPPEEAKLCVGPTGFVLLAPLPDERWILFVAVDEAPGGVPSGPPEAADLAELVNRRLGTDAGLHDLRWASYFSMHSRIAPRLADGRRFLMGDAAHASSPTAGEGLNSALMDAADIAWKLALVLRGAAPRSLLDSYALERGLADHHVLEVSDLVHRRVMGLVDTYARGEIPALPPPDPARDLAFQRSRAMLDVSYVGSPLVAEYVGAGTHRPPGPAPGERFPDRIRLTGTDHHLLLFGPPLAGPGLDRFRARWGGLVAVADGAGAGFDAARAGVPEGGAVLVRPDGFIAFRAVPADSPGLDALDAHLATYLLPAATAPQPQQPTPTA
jgi:2-polyprenyl-6-methoxyphenol hydroxylase-like FAD-dependent oxidoreductase